MNDKAVLIIEDDAATDAVLHAAFAEASLPAESVSDGLLAMEKLRDNHYCAVVLDPMIRHRLNGHAVLNFIELEQPETLSRLFLLTGMSKQTITRTAPALVPRLFRKPAEASKVVEAVASACHPSPPARATRGSLLLVEDDPATANITISLLEELGYSVKWAQNGAEALEAIFHSEFSAIMLDLVMPEVDGFTVLEHLQSTKPHLLRRVIVTTGIPDRYAEALDASKVCGVIRKPVEITQLQDLLIRCSSDGQRFESGGESPQLV